MKISLKFEATRETMNAPAGLSDADFEASVPTYLARIHTAINYDYPKAVIEVARVAGERTSVTVVADEVENNVRRVIGEVLESDRWVRTPVPAEPVAP